MQPSCTRAAWVAAAPLLLTACQSYQPKELEPEQHLAEWRTRLPDAALVDSESVRSFAHALGRQPAGASGFDVADGLTLDEGRLVALAFHPELRLARLRLQRDLGDVELAGLFDDPQFQATLLRVTESAPDRWFLSPGLSFTIPLTDRLDAERDQAAAGAEVALARFHALQWSLWREVRQAWVAWSATELAKRETESYLTILDGLVRTTAKLREAGELPRTEAALFEVERARHANELVRLVGEQSALELALRSLLGLAPEADVELVALTALSTSPSSGTPPTSLAEHPALLERRAAYQVAEETLRLEITRQTPDLTLGPLWEADQGVSKLGLFGGLPLPLWNRNSRAIARARAERELARAEFEAAHQTLLGRLSQALMRARTLQEARAGLEGDLVPLVDRQLADATELMRIGEGSSLVLLESLRRAHDTRLALIETRAQEARVDAELEHLTGPPQARPTPSTRGAHK